MSSLLERERIFKPAQTIRFEDFDTDGNIYVFRKIKTLPGTTNCVDYASAAWLVDSEGFVNFSVEDGYVTATGTSGISFWSCIPEEEMKIGDEEEVWVSPTRDAETLKFHRDRDFKLQGSGTKEITLRHYLLKPTKKVPVETFWKDLCELFEKYTLVETRASSTPSSFFNSSNTTQCSGPESIVQYCLCKCWKDEHQPPDIRFDAMVLAFWDKLYSTSLEELKLDASNRWAVDFMHFCVKNYPLTPEEIEMDFRFKGWWEHALTDLSI